MFLSICTPTYNREYTLKRVYKSLLSQTICDFEWIVIDDGSIDNTKELIFKFIAEGKLDIKYFYQENQGKHIALNKGIELAKGDLFTCLDSDDWLYPNAVESIKKMWTTVSENTHLVGIISLDTFENGDVVGKRFPDNLKKVNWIDLKYKYKVTGDKDFYFKTKELKKVKFPNIGKNKHMPPGYQYYMLSKKFDFYLLNTPTKYVEYLEDGISKNKFNKYVVAPDNFALYRFEIMDLIPTINEKIKNAIHFNASISLGNIKLIPKKKINKILVAITKPLGYIFALYIKRNVNKRSDISHNIKIAQK